METLLQITYLNDFVFCPYSIYLHQVFDSSHEQIYTALPQHNGKLLHDKNIKQDKNSSNTNVSVLKEIYVVSNNLGVYGKIDTLYIEEKKLVESKFLINRIYKGYYYQIWAQYFALIEMGFEVNEIEFYSIKDKKSYPITLPDKSEYMELRNHIRTIARFDFEKEINVNPAKCSHCIYAALCDKTNSDHVYA